MSRWNVFLGVFRRDLTMFKRYPFNTLSSIATIFFVFLLLFYGSKGIAGPVFATSGTSEGLVVGYIVWALAVMGYSELSWSLNQEAQVGTLEQLYLCPYGFWFVCLSHLVSDLLFNLLISLILLTLMMATTGLWLRIDLVSLAPVVVLTVASAYGIGFVVAGLALVYKRVQAFFQIVQFVFVAFIAVPSSQFPWVRYLPLSTGNYLMRQIMVEGKRAWQLPPGDMAVLIGTAVFYLFLGLLAFRFAEKVAKERGLLGQY